MEKDTPKRIIRVFHLLDYLGEFPPKTVGKLASMLGANSKTVYKDIQLLHTLGYEVTKDSAHRHFLTYHTKTAYQLSEYEKNLIIGAVSQAGYTTNDIISIKQKLKSKQYHSKTDEKIIKQLKIVKILADAVEHKMVVTLLDYRTTTLGSKIRDRVVLPLYLDTNRMSITAYEYDKKMCRIFKVSRISDVVPVADILEKYINDVPPMVDAFGFAGRMDYVVEMYLTNRGAALLSEEFNIACQPISSETSGFFQHYVTCRVCGYEGVGRFVLGMMSEVKVLGDEGFKSYLINKMNASTLF